MRKVDLSGRRFGLLVARDDVGTKGGRRIWECDCDCGNVTTVAASNLTTGNSSSCGCKFLSAVTRHGKSFHPLYKTWMGIWQRCTDKSNKDYKNYGGRGISVCGRWKDIDLFIFDMGSRPDGGTIDRKDNNKNYSKSNCRWATRTEQVRNRRVTKYLTLNGETLTMKQWSEKIGITYSSLHQRVNSLGWSVKKALTHSKGRWPNGGVL